MKTILLSIYPEYCQKIFSGEKTIEIRKVYIEPPFKAVVYCTKHPHLTIVSGGGTANLFYAMNSFAAIPVGGDIANGKVIGEFVCDKVDKISVHNDILYSERNMFANKLQNMCLSIEQIKEYLNGKTGFAWGISDLKIYDKPRELGEFRYYKKEKYGSESVGYVTDKTLNNVTRPPRNYMYVEELL